MSEFRKNILTYFLGTIIVIISIEIFDIKQSLLALLNISTSYLILSIAIAQIIYLVSGLQYNTILKVQGLQLSKFDIIVLPVVMNLWSLLVPFQGALLFSTIFFNKKYGRTVSDSLSVSLFLYMITVSFTGFIGLIFMLLYERNNLFVLILLTFFMLAPFLLSVISYFFRHSELEYNSLPPNLSKLSKFILTSFDSILSLLNDRHLLYKIIILKLAQTFLVGFWYWIIAKALSIEINFIVLMILSLIGELALIIKITPDNIGVNQLLSGTLLAAMGFNPQWGVIISLAASATTLLLIFTVGLYGNHIFMKQYGITSIKEFAENLKKVGS